MKKSLSLSLFLAFALQTVNLSAAASLSPASELLSSQIEATSFNPTFFAQSATPIKIKVEITAYSSTASQTDDTPFITASGKRVKDGIVAANFLKFGTKIKIPELFGDKVFIVEDRMASRYFHRIDIWFADTRSAHRFGINEAEIVVL